VNHVPLIVSSISLLIWTVLTFFRGSFWQLGAFNEDAKASGSVAKWPRVAVVVPARNEAETIARCITSLASQEYPGEFQIVVVDDHSVDGTAELAKETTKAAASGGRPVTVVKARELPTGWTGKLWALQQGVHAASISFPEYFWFTDGDVVHAPDTLCRLVTRAETGNLDLASLMVLLQTKTFPERLLIPAFLYFFLMLYPPQWIAAGNARTAGAAGGCILLRAETLARIGGLSAIRTDVIDDCALARAVKRSGGMIWMGLTRSSISLREYATFREIRDLIARTAFTQLSYSFLRLLGTIAGMLVTYLAPVVLTFEAGPLVWRISLATWALMTLTYLPTVRFYRLFPLWAPLLPVAAMFYSYATCLSAARYWLGRGGQWKGRTQAPART
jgi:hopene-associated glycosyltransferase HpnB